MLRMWPSSMPGRVSVGHVDERRRVGVEEAVGDRLVHAPVAERRVEPDLVLRDRAADRRVEVPDLRRATLTLVRLLFGVEGRVAGEVAARARLAERRRPAVVRRPRRRRVVAEHDAVERVAAVLRHHVDAHAALAHLGRVGAGDVADFLEAAVVPVDAAVGAVARRGCSGAGLRSSARCRPSRGTGAATAAGCPSRRRRATARRRRRARSPCRES